MDYDVTKSTLAHMSGWQPVFTHAVCMSGFARAAESGVIHEHIRSSKHWDRFYFSFNTAYYKITDSFNQEGTWQFLNKHIISLTSGSKD